MPCVYITENLHNKELSISPWRYIGSDQNDDPEYYGSNRDLKRDIAFLGKDKFKKIVIKYYETIDNKELRKIEADEFLKPNNVKNDISYYNKSDIYGPGGSPKGVKHKKPRSEEHRKKISEHRTGSTKSESAREKMRQKKLGRKAADSTKELMSSQRIGELNNNALEWTVTTPEGIVHQVNALRAWCRENNVNFYEVYESRKGWTSIKYGAGKGGGRKKQEKTI